MFPTISKASGFGKYGTAAEWSLTQTPQTLCFFLNTFKLCVICPLVFSPSLSRAKCLIFVRQCSYFEFTSSTVDFVSLMHISHFFTAFLIFRTALFLFASYQLPQPRWASEEMFCTNTATCQTFISQLHLSGTFSGYACLCIPPCVCGTIIFLSAIRGRSRLGLCYCEYRAVSVSHTNLLLFSCNINVTASVSVCMRVHGCRLYGEFMHRHAHKYFVTASLSYQVNPHLLVRLFRVSLNAHGVRSLSFSSPTLSLSTAAVFKEGWTTSVYYNACELTVLWQDDWTRMKGRYNPMCAPAGWPSCPRSSLIHRAVHRSRPPPASRLSTHIAISGPQRRLTLVWLVDITLELSQSNRIGWHPVTRVGLDGIVFVPADARVIGWHLSWPIRAIPFGPVCFEAVQLVRRYIYVRKFDWQTNYNVKCVRCVVCLHLIHRVHCFVP